MYGLIHECFRQMIVETVGEQIWKDILKHAGFVSGKENIINHHYADSDTYAIVDSAVLITKKSREEIWEWFGRYYVTFAINCGFEDLFRCLGSHLKDFLNNLDSMHYFMSHVIYKANLQGPSFRCEDGDDGAIILHYYSSRNGLYPIVKGIVEELARLIFKINVEIIFLNRTQRSIQYGIRDNIEEHVTFRIKFKRASVPTSATSLASLTSLTSLLHIENVNARLYATIEDLRALLPFHVVINRYSNLVGCGKNLSQFVDSNLLKIGTPISKIFRIYRPHRPLDYENICNFINAVYVLEVRNSTPKRVNIRNQAGSLTPRPLMLKGQMMRLSGEEGLLLYICTPYAASAVELTAYGLYLNQIPLFDPARDLIILNQKRLADVELNLQLEANMDQLENMAADLQNEKAVSDALLKEVLPPIVAEQLLAGAVIDSREYSEATIMFCDVPNFQQIVAQSPPHEIVNILNVLFTKFDALIEYHKVFKVETVGETYMTVSGVPDLDETHCEKICHVALGMLWEARTVVDPISKNFLRVRCGIHTGNVVAGVIGTRMPRFCLFGDTVNTSSRMQSHSPIGRIHCSDATRDAALRVGRFEFISRGIIPIKGKGFMHTSFLLKSKKKSIWEITKSVRDEKVHSIDGYAELHEGLEADLVNSNNLPKCCTIS